MALQTQVLLNEKDFFMPNITPHIFQVEEFFCIGFFCMNLFQNCLVLKALQLYL